MKRFREGEQSRYRTFWLETNVITMAVLRWTKANRLQWHSWFNCAAVELSMGQEQFKVSWLLQTQLNQDGTKEEVKTPRRQVSSMNRKTKWNGKVFLKGTSKGLKQSQREKSDKYINKNKKKFKLKKWAVLDVACKTNLNSKMGQNCICPNWVPSIACP